MKIPSPAHTISQNNIRSPEEKDNVVEQTNENLLETQTNEPNDDEEKIDQSTTKPEETEIKNDVKTDLDEKPINENEST